MLTLRPLLAAVLALSLLPRDARAQETPHRETFAPGVEFASLTLQEAVAKAHKEFKLLVVYQYEPGSPEAALASSKLLANPTLALFLKWHAVTVKQTASCGGVVLTVYKGDGRFPPRESYGCISCMTDGVAAGIDRVISKLPALQTGGRTLRQPPGPTPGAAGALFTVDLALDKIRALDPVWYELHNHRNPPPEPPPLPPPFHLQDDGLGEMIGPDDEAAAGEGPQVTLDRLAAARRAVFVGDLHRATGLYTWLWECGAQQDPAFAPARRSFLIAEIADLSARRDGCRERFTNIRNAHAARLLWATYDEYHEWCALNAACGDDGFTVEWFDYFINDEQEATMLPRADKAAYELLLARESFGDPLELGADPVARVRRIAAARNRPCPVTSVPQDWARFQTFAGTLLLHEACRLHAACLAAGRDADARAIADILLAAGDTPLARRALATTALVAGQVRRDHLDLLAAIPGPRDPATATLEAHLSAALNGAGPTPAP